MGRCAIECTAIYGGGPVSSRREREASAVNVDSVALGRLIAEVSTPGRSIATTGYNRSYNRHNR